MRIVFAFLVIIFTNAANSYSPNPPMTTIRQGQLSGILMTSEKGREIYGFRGIPYAKPPVNELRFKRPVPAEPWDGIFNADPKEIPPCPQITGDHYHGNENCLFLNVYTPSEYFNNSIKLPVMIYINSGGFIKDNVMGIEYYPTKLLDRNIILVTFNHRLGILGFLSTGDEVMPGNYGLFDQVEAMKWVQQNIDAFGGNPKKVTIVGAGAGSSAVSMHIVSPASKNLFHGAIAHSGTYLGTPANNSELKKIAKGLAMKLNCPSVSSQQLLNCLMNKSAQELLAVKDSSVLPGPCVENTPDGFFPYNPRKDFDKISVDVPVMIGMTQEEGYYIYVSLEANFDQLSENYIRNHLPIVLQTLLKEGNLEKYKEEIVEYFFHNISFTDKKAIRKALIQLYSDIYVAVGAEKFLQLLHTKQVATYAFKLTYRGSVCRSQYYNCTNPGSRGPAHGEELPFIFPFQKLTKVDNAVSDIMLDLWSNFATYQNPTPNEYSAFRWLQTTAKQPNYLNINLNPKMGTGHLSNNVAAWDKAAGILESSNNCTTTNYK